MHPESVRKAIKIIKFVHIIVGDLSKWLSISMSSGIMEDIIVKEFLPFTLLNFASSPFALQPSSIHPSQCLLHHAHHGAARLEAPLLQVD